MKITGTTINFVTDTVKRFEKKQDLLLTSLRHYCIPLGNDIRKNLGAKGMPPKKEITVMAIQGWNDKSRADKRKAILKLQ